MQRYEMRSWLDLTVSSCRSTIDKECIEIGEPYHRISAIFADNNAVMFQRIFLPLSTNRSNILEIMARHRPLSTRPQ